MSDTKKRRRRVELRLVDVPPPAEPPSGGGMGAAPGDRPVVQIVAGKRSEAIDQAERHLIERDVNLFFQGERIVRVAPEDIDLGQGQRARTLRIVPVTIQHMRERFTRAIDLQRYDKRAKEWMSCDCPGDFAEAYLDRYGHWGLPNLRAVVTAPTLRPDGTVIEQPGYDQATGVYYDPRGTVFPPVPRAPDRAAALEALDRLKCVIATFDFCDDASRSVALSAFLTALQRRMMTAAPLHGFSAPVAGCGKSKLVDIVSILATGHRAAVMSLGDKPEEFEKRLGAAMLAGAAIIPLDNIEQALGGEFLCELLTAGLLSVRVLGKSLMVKVPNVFAVYATGNNLKVLGDATRRSLISRLDPHCERPELREFETPDPVVTASLQRVDLVISALVIMRAFFLAGAPCEIAPLGSFDEWSRWVRDPLIWLGEADPVSTIEATRAEDPRLAALVAVAVQWHRVTEKHGPARVSVRELIGLAEAQTYDGSAGGWAHPDFRQSLLEVAGERGDKVNSRRLGNWLGHVAGRQVDVAAAPEVLNERCS